METKIVTLPKYVLSFVIVFYSFLNAFQDYKSYSSATLLLVVLQLLFFFVDKVFPGKPCYNLFEYKDPVGYEIWRWVGYPLLNSNWFILYHCLQMHMLLGRPIEILLGWQTYLAVYLVAAWFGTPFPTFVAAYSIFYAIYPTYLALNVVEICVNVLCLFLEHFIIIRDSKGDGYFNFMFCLLGLMVGYTIAILGILMNNPNYLKMSVLKPFIKIHTCHFLMYRLNRICLNFPILLSTGYVPTSCMSYRVGRTKTS